MSGVPGALVSLQTSEGVKIQDTPKSAIFAVMSEVRRTLLAERSQ